MKFSAQFSVFSIAIIGIVHSAAALSAVDIFPFSPIQRLVLHANRSGVSTAVSPLRDAIVAVKLKSGALPITPHQRLVLRMTG